ncbi:MULTISPECIES: S8 family serine peptidase [unclassified Saccharothrix]|uniref:S8 family serine peptidase n=1 Tax=unclassified Saccharothrix TaxID=2593673 RepID=UPI00307F5221
MSGCRHTTPGRRRATSAVALVVAALLPAGAPPGAGATTAEPAAATTTERITLITGDVVVHEGDPATARVEPAPRVDGSQPAFLTTTTERGVFVQPSDALPLIDAGTLDPALFDITALAADGRGDRETPAIPVIAEPDGRPLELTVHTRLSGAVGARVPKANAPEVWQSLKDGDAGVAKLSLDRKVTPLLDRSTAQVGAPAAWRLGLDGSGVKVAVVDTGVDAEHPDLAGRVAAAADFTADGDTVDRHGHGTHVASTIAGTGASSGGRYRGVAPGATLLSAKVFDRDGSGDESQVMAGIEWAVAQGADVVNLSLGAGVTDGSDPLSELVDTLSERTGTLFVVAAGNSGSGDRTVTTPGAAARALTVGAVDRDDKLAWFSSRGPRLRDALVKPEIVAPGVDIVAARAAGTSLGTPVDDHHTAASGTSMATPHVTGAAALLAQQHPDWTGQALKDTLASTAKDVGHKWYEQGAGRLDVARAVTQRETGPASASFGRVEGTEPTRRTVTFRNDGDSTVRADLALGVQSWDGSKPDADSVRLGATAVTVPAGSTGDATVAVDPDEGPFGVYGGTLVATTPGGGTVRTPVSTYHPAPLVPVSVRVLDSTGAPAQRAAVHLLDDTLGATNHNDPFLDEVEHRVDLVEGAGRVMLPRGAYSALGWATETGLTSRRWTGLSAAEIRVDGPTTVTLDARAAVPVALGTTTRTDQRDRTVALRRVLPATAQRSGTTAEVGLSAGTTDWEVRVTPAPATKTGAISLQDYAVLGTTAVDFTASDGTRFSPAYDVGSVTATWPGEHRLTVAAGEDIRGKAVLVRVPAPTGTTDPVAAVTQAVTSAARTAAQAGAAAVVAYVDVPGALPVGPLRNQPLPVFSLSRAEGEALRTGPGEVVVTVRPAPEAMFNLSVVDRNGIPGDHVRRFAPGDLVATKTTYHADQPGLTAQKTWFAFPEELWKTQFVQGARIPAAGTWTEYTGPADDQTVWKRVTNVSAGTQASLSMNQFTVYRPGRAVRPDEHWFRAPVRSAAVELPADHPARLPGAAGRWRVLCSHCREGDLFTPALQWTDGEHYVSPQDNSKYFATTTARLFQGEREIAPVEDPFARFPRFPLDPGSAKYRLEVVDAMAGAGKLGAPSTLLFAHARRVATTWTFTSARSDSPPPIGFSCQAGDRCSFQPLIQVDHRLPLDATNTLTGDTFEVAAASHTGARGAGPVLWLRIAYSTDGTTWTDLSTKALDTGRWSVAAPKVSGDVWLRTEARDTRGNTVVQTVERAYRGG